jgi:divalent anion:Na+ symporter, DASS family
MARAELGRMGTMTGAEKLMLGVFAIVTTLWITKTWHGVDYPVVALLGLGVLLVSRVLTWDDVLAERAAWDVLVWYGAIYGMARALGDAGIMKVFAQGAAQATAGWLWWGTLAAVLCLFYYSHYFFASVTARVSAMFLPFLLVTIAAGTPPWLAVLALGYLSSLAASLTHYGTTSSPIYYGAGYMTQRTWWRLGLIIATANAVIWSTVGPLWWKVLGWW